MRIERVAAVAALAGALSLSSACEKPPAASAAATAEEAEPAPRVMPTPPPERHVLDPIPTPVRGHFKEVNTGDFDLVDGIAWASAGETVVYVTSKEIASSALASSPCPMTHARFLTALRDAGWNEVTLDAKGTSSYYGNGTPYGGRGHETEVGGHYWKSWLETANGRAMGSVEHRHYGGFEFALSVLKPTVFQQSEIDLMSGHRGSPGEPTPKEPRVAAAYRETRTAAMKRDLDGLLRLQGFDAKQVAAIRGLAGIQADLAAFADRFLKPGAAGDFDSGPGWGSLSASGRNSKGAKFINYYFFTTCGERLVLTMIGENPQ
jgi:hypothetical protein